jgi:hypothetical protein
MRPIHVADMVWSGLVPCKYDARGTLVDLTLPARHRPIKSEPQRVFARRHRRSVLPPLLPLPRSQAASLLFALPGLTAASANTLSGAMNPSDLRLADPSSYHDRRRYANRNYSSISRATHGFSDPI